MSVERDIDRYTDRLDYLGRLDDEVARRNDERACRSCGAETAPFPFRSTPPCPDCGELWQRWTVDEIEQEG